MLLSQIIEKAELFKTSEQHHTLTLQLKPEHLGKLDLELTTKDGTVTARISAESSLVREKLEQLLPQIKEHLAQQGVNLGQITVDVSSHQPDDRRREARPEKSRATARIGQEEPSAAEASRNALPALRRMALNISRVDLTV
jgi:flagellar hook-length control protein FliK